jgi:hypothetical protein
MNNKALAFIGILAIFIVGVVILTLKKTMPAKTSYNDTYLLIGSVLDDFDALGADVTDQQRLIADLVSQTNSFSINQKIASCLRAKTNNPRPLNSFDLTGGVFRDAWGTSLQFALTKDATNPGLLPLVNGRLRPFVVWSAGPNRTNEFGLGDDVFIIGR